MKGRGQAIVMANGPFCLDAKDGDIEEGTQIIVIGRTSLSRLGMFCNLDCKS